LKKQGPGIFGKVFFYTLFFLIISIITTATFFAGQFISVYETSQKQQLTDSYLPLAHALEGKSKVDAREIAWTFHEKNASFEFSIRTDKDEIIYETPAFASASKINTTSDTFFQFIVPRSNGMILYMATASSNTATYSELLMKAAITLLILLLVSIIATAIFASRIVNPIKHLARDVGKMSNLELISAPPPRSDEIGQLSSDVYRMYEALKTAISQLETEIERKKEMEESQRYFFSAASHELKTPIAAATTLLEGMLEHIVDCDEYPYYLRECLKMMTLQRKLISEILEIVRLTDGKISLKYESARLTTVVTSVLISFQALIEANEQQISVTLPDDLHCMIDISLFNRVLSNVIMNAVQNTPRQGEIRIWSEDQDETTIKLCILNTGAHIEEKLLEKLFEAFYRRDKARSKYQGRSGLGLTLVKKSLDHIQLPFALKNTEAGVLFWVRLPLAKN
jgi:two-component system sensor histidine kinase VanS